MYWVTPEVDIIPDSELDMGDCEYDGENIAALFTKWGIPCKHIHTSMSASVILFHFNLEAVTDMRKIKRFLPVLEAALHTKVSVGVSPIAHYSLLLNRASAKIVPFKSVLATENFYSIDSPLAMFLGRDTSNHSLCIDLTKLPHLLIGGATGSGKSVCVNTIISSILFRATPSCANFVMIDPKQVELSMYEGLPHLCLPIVTDTEHAIGVLRGVCQEMDKRYGFMKEHRLKDIENGGKPRLVVVIDELADLMLKRKEDVESYITRIAQLGRAAGIHLIVATQRPTSDIITGLIKSNLTARIALKTISMRDSMNIIDKKGAEELIGRGDAILKLPDRVEMIRFQTAYINDADIEAIVNHWKNNALVEQFTKEV